MPRPKFDAPPRFFNVYDLYGEPLPEDRLVYLELLEVDTEAGVARFSYRLADPGAELWAATVPGWESRKDVVVAVREAAVAALVEGGELEIPLSEHPQVTQLEVRFASGGSGVGVYRIITRGSDERVFSYRTERDPEAALAAGRFAVVMEDGRPVFDTEATQDEVGIVDEDGRPVFDTEAPDEGWRKARIGDSERFVLYRQGGE